MTADLTPQGTPWQDGPPDPKVSRWWWVDRGSGAILAAEFLAPNGRDLYIRNQRIVGHEWPDWPAGWRCAPVSDARAEYERGRREMAEACMDICDEMSVALGSGRARMGPQEALQKAAYRILALAPRPEAAPPPAAPSKVKLG